MAQFSDASCSDATKFNICLNISSVLVLILTETASKLLCIALHSLVRGYFVEKNFLQPVYAKVILPGAFSKEAKSPNL